MEKFYCLVTVKPGFDFEALTFKFFAEGPDQAYRFIETTMKQLGYRHPQYQVTILKGASLSNRIVWDNHKH